MGRTGLLLEVLTRFFFYLCITNYIRAAFGDPGYVDKMNFVKMSESVQKDKKKPEDVLPEKAFKVCGPCNNIWKPPRAHHCRVCKRCVFRVRIVEFNSIFRWIIIVHG